jgi:hypothetical protein
MKVRIEDAFKKRNFTKTYLKLFIVLACLFGILAAILVMNREEKTQVITSVVKEVAQGRLIEGENASKEPGILMTDSKLTFESEEIAPEQKDANATAIVWDQNEDREGVELQIRTFNGKTWSEWLHSEDQQDRKDGSRPVRAMLAINENIKKVQIMDTTKGPSATKKSATERILEKVGINKVVRAGSDGPRIISRAEWWGNESINNELNYWPPEYEGLYRAVVHHTVTGQGDSSAIMRAIWQFHTYTNGWGDIGYNYVVDSSGNIFQGRYYDPNVAHNLKKDVIGAHALSNNRGTTGVATIGDFSNARPTDKMIDSVANIIAFKSAKYYFNPSGIGPNGPNVVGHRNVGQTSCPGQQLYDRLGDIRRVGDIYYAPRTNLNRLDLTNQGQGFDGNFAFSTSMKSGDTKQAYFDLKNEGDNVWGNYGANPVVLGTDQPRDRTSSFATTGSWRGVNRAVSFTHKVVTGPDNSKTLVATDTILPGETGRFTFAITAPEIGGVYREHFQLLIENKEWFSRNLMLSITINVTPKIYSWQPVAQHIFTDDQQTTSASTTNLIPNQRVYLVIKAKNTGNQTWYNDGPYPVRVAASGPRDRLSVVCDPVWLSCNRPGGLSEVSVAPGVIGTFGFWIYAPNIAGYNSNEYFSLVAENKTWINTEPGVYWPVSVRR